MRQRKFQLGKSRVLAVLAMALLLPIGARAASKYKVLYRFKQGTDGAHPSTLIFDGGGNLYGTTEGGGRNNFDCPFGTCGTVFKLKPNSDGSWTESVLYNFCSLTNCADGGAPVSGLIFDDAGNLYGTTLMGGASTSGCLYSSCGTVFKLKPNSDGSWTESVVYTFTGGADGANPVASLIFDGTGNLYGTTEIGGNDTCNAPDGCGVVFKLTPNSDGSWSESILHTFTGGTDGGVPAAGLIFDPAGNLYGTTYAGGGGTKCSAGCGVVFELKTNSDGSWTESVLHTFTGGPDGSVPAAALIFDAAWNLYGTTYGGGHSPCPHGLGCGVVFELKPNSDGSWTESVLHRFVNHLAANPSASLIFDKRGNLYGTATYGGPADGGAVFKLAPQSTGGWAYAVVHEFLDKPAQGPFAGLILDTAGNLYGDTAYGARSEGVVFEIAP
jgi:uncharacterized repeat protein (TIGR03803 family)